MAQLVIIIMPRTKTASEYYQLKTALRGILEQLNTPHLIVKASSVQREETHKMILYKALVAARSVPFVPKDLPIFEARPVMVMGF